jgi:hypothetical protein
MIPYELVVTASHRPHLLEPTLRSLLARIDQPPTRVLIHDDAAPNLLAPAEQEAERLAVAREMTKGVLAGLNLPCPVGYISADPPRKLGLALRTLLDQVQTDYVLYSQDDFVTVRPVPIRDALRVLDALHWHQIRFNKRATLAQKDTWQGPWKKEEQAFRAHETSEGEVLDPPLEGIVTVSDHWYFQLGLWRVSPIRAALRWLTATPERRAWLAQGLAEEQINAVLDGRHGFIPGLIVPYQEDAHEPRTRKQVQKTFIWGPIGEDRYIRHIGGAAPTAAYPRDGGVDDPAQAWREIASYPPPPEANA